MAKDELELIDFYHGKRSLINLVVFTCNLFVLCVILCSRYREQDVGGGRGSEAGGRCSDGQDGG